MKQLKSVLAVVLVLTFALSLAACGTPVKSTPTGTPESTMSTPPESAPPAEPVKPVLLAVSFGTSYNDSREITIGAIENGLATAYPEYEVRRAFTSQIIIDILKERDKLEIDNVTEAMDRLIADGVKDVVIQPTHVMNGYEYDDVVAEVTPYKEKFDSFKIGEPLLISDADYDGVVSAITAQTAAYNADGTAIVFMGHGTEHESNAAYAKLQQKLTDAGHNNYFIGTVEAEPTVKEVLALVQASGAKKVVLLPLMIVAGDHANNDMASDEEDSWKSIFEAEGFEVECVLQGLGQNPAIQQIFIKHVAAAIAQ